MPGQIIEFRVRTVNAVPACLKAGKWLGHARTRIGGLSEGGGQVIFHVCFSGGNESNDP
jgi:hypothetical protein